MCFYTFFRLQSLVYKAKYNYLRLFSCQRNDIRALYRFSSSFERCVRAERHTIPYTHYTCAMAQKPESQILRLSASKPVMVLIVLQPGHAHPTVKQPSGL